MTERELTDLRTQLAAARTRAPAPSTSLAQIRAALAEHMRFEMAVGHLNTADTLAQARDMLATLEGR